MDNTALSPDVSVGQLRKFARILEAHGMGSKEIQRFIDDLVYRQRVLEALRADNAGYVLPSTFDEAAAHGMIRNVFLKDIKRAQARRQFHELSPDTEWDNADGHVSGRRNPLVFLAQTDSLRELLGKLTPLQQQILVLRYGLEGQGALTVQEIEQRIGLFSGKVGKGLTLGRGHLHFLGEKLLSATRDSKESLDPNWHEDPEA